MTSLRIFFYGGQMTYRALFYWLTPQIYVPSLLVAPIFQILLFAYIGRSAGLESDKFYVVGNAIQYAAIPCLFAMTQMIGGERYQNTLSASCTRKRASGPWATAKPPCRQTSQAATAIVA